VPFEVKRVVETLATQRTEISLDVTVALDVSTQHPLLRKRFAADATAKLVVCRLLSCKYRGKPHNHYIQFRFSAGYCDLRLRTPQYGKETDDQS